MLIPLSVRRRVSDSLQPMGINRTLHGFLNYQVGPPSLHSVYGYGRHPADSKLQFPSMDLQQPIVVLDSSTGSRPPRNESGEATCVEYLRYRSSMTIVAKPLKTGNSTAVHGLLQVLHRQLGGSAGLDGKGVAEALLQYKALDSGVYCAVARS